TQDAVQLKALQVGALTKFRSIELHHVRAAISRSPDSGLMTRPGALGCSGCAGTYGRDWVTAGTQDAVQLKALQVGALTKFRSIELHHGRAAISRSPDSGLMTRPGALGYFRLRRNVWSGLVDCLRTAFRSDSDTGRFTTYCAVYRATGIQRSPQFCIHRNLPSALDHRNTFAKIVK
ncbi:TPA: hypothetical protein ACQGUY_004920, partial [Pseudomonas aeruginosa]